MENYLNKSEAKNIAKVLIASSGLAFDSEAFEDCDDYLTEDDKQLIVDEIQKECKRIIKNVQSKFTDEINYEATVDVVSSMYFE